MLLHCQLWDFQNLTDLSFPGVGDPDLLITLETAPDQCTRQAKTEVESVCTLGDPTAAQHAFRYMYYLQALMSGTWVPPAAQSKVNTRLHHVHNVLSIVHSV